MVLFIKPDTLARFSYIKKNQQRNLESNCNLEIGT